MNKLKHLSLLFLGTLFFSGCVASKVEKFSSYEPATTLAAPVLSTKEGEKIIERYYSQGWEPYLYVLSLGIIPDHRYVVFQEVSGEYRKESSLMGWFALPLGMTPEWQFGRISKQKESNRADSLR